MKDVCVARRRDTGLSVRIEPTSMGNTTGFILRMSSGGTPSVTEVKTVSEMIDRILLLFTGKGLEDWKNELYSGKNPVL